MHFCFVTDASTRRSGILIPAPGVKTAVSTVRKFPAARVESVMSVPKPSAVYCSAWSFMNGITRGHFISAYGVISHFCAEIYCMNCAAASSTMNIIQPSKILVSIIQHNTYQKQVIFLIFGKGGLYLYGIYSFFFVFISISLVTAGFTATILSIVV